MTDQVLPLCVDLDGTLIHSDLLIESALALLARNPLYGFAMLFWLFRGKAHLKQEIAKRCEIQVATLPFNATLIDWLHEQRPRRPLVLCTASDAKLASAVAIHLGFFSEVMASNGITNLSGHNKCRALVRRFGERCYDYAGNGKADIEVWQHARNAIVVDATPALQRAAAQAAPVERIFERRPRRLQAWFRALRLHQWLKNLLTFLPLLTAHRLFDIAALTDAGLGFLSFGLCASGVYLLNDLLDLDADRRHPRKRRRPFASGSLPLAAGLIAAPLLTLGAFGLAVALDPRFALVLLGYYALTLAYSLWLKRIVMLDVIVLAALYTVRIIAGTVVIDQALSFWLLAFSMFIFLSLAMLKRYTELLAMQTSGESKASGRGYNVDDLALIQSLGGASGYLSVLVLALYINSTASEALYRHPQVLWLLCPLLLYWISRVWVIAHRGLMHDDPVIFAVVDRVSRVVLALGAIVVIGAL
ncbi:MAG: UbiA family prenyltransferase [Alphaproteobacteria bacterium]|nr:UbiA family prenyltransferase [Alphaproteobacteria bacterium]